MTVSSGILRALVAAATPRKLDERTRTHVLFLYDGEPDVYKGFDHEADAQLVALAPDLAVLLADTMDELAKWSEWAERIEWVRLDGDTWDGGFASEPTNDLLARFRALEERADGQTEGRAGDGR